jgi:rhodanese-related sulfurtransferase
MKLYAITGGVIIFAALGWMLMAGSGGNTVEPKQAEMLLESGDTNYVFLDVRTPKEYDSETGHLKGATLIPVQELEGRLGELAADSAKTIIAYCRSGHRSGIATDMLLKHGFKAQNMVGGMLRWNAENRPVVKTEIQDSTQRSGGKQ